LPGITDSEDALDGMARRAASAGASFFAANPLFLKPCSRPTYLSFVREHFPTLVADYAKRYGHADFVATPYRQQMARIVERVCQRYKLGRRSVGEMMTPSALPSAEDLSFIPVQKDQPRPAPRKPPANHAGITTQPRLFA
jgi:hypothetical protein